MGLPKRHRLKAKRLFRKTLNQPKFAASSALCVLVLPHEPTAVHRQGLQCGIVISKKVHKRAHERHQIRRRLREIIRKDVLCHPAVTAYRTLVLIVRSAAVGTSYQRLRFQLLKALGIPEKLSLSSSQSTNG